jgi:hypothetical protein
VTNALVPSADLWACTNGNITDHSFAEWDNTALPVAGSTTLGLFALWDDLVVDETEGGSLVHQTVLEGGVNVEVVQWHQVRTFDGGPMGPTGSFEIKIFASGPVLAQFIYLDTGFAGAGASATVGIEWPGPMAPIAQQFSMNTPSVPSGLVISVIAGSPPTPCYPNCDGSTTAPCLNVADFGCFLNRFGAGDTYANCDGSTTPPVLNVADFGCFLNAFGAGCGTSC